MQGMRETADMDGVAFLVRTDRSDRTDLIAQLCGDLHELKGMSNFSERHNHVADLQYSVLNDKCDMQRRQIFCGGDCSGEMVRRLANESKGVDVSIDDINGCIAYTIKEVLDNVFRKSVARA